MRWYKQLYLGEKAKKRRASILRSLREGRTQAGVHVIVPASGERNILDILPSYVLEQEYYRRRRDSLYILGIGADYDEALAVAGQIIHEIYSATGGFALDVFFEPEKSRASEN